MVQTAKERRILVPKVRRKRVRKFGPNSGVCCFLGTYRPPRVVQSEAFVYQVSPGFHVLHFVGSVKLVLSRHNVPRQVDRRFSPMGPVPLVQEQRFETQTVFIVTTVSDTRSYHWVS